MLWMKKRLGIEHVGIGTDAGGLPEQLPGYKDWQDLPLLDALMSEVGFSKDEIAAVMGLNVRRVMGECY
jgi:microsomal dipeptidase-like Zn-dependent dipeptidase